MKFQINEKYRLGKDTREFIKYLENQSWSTEAGMKSKYFNYIKNSLWDMRFDDEFFDYCKETKGLDFHEQLSKKLEVRRKKKKTELENKDKK
jgi:hypothetical protein